MDEPLSALDKQLREHMQIEIRALHERLGATTIYVTHDQREALTMSHRVAVLNQGRIAQLGAPAEIYNYPANAFVADFIGEAVLAPVTRCDDYSVLLDGRRMVSARPVPSSGDLVLVIRSEKLRLARPGAENAIEAVVRKHIFQGESHVLLVELGGGLTFTIRQPTHVETDGLLPKPGRKGRLRAPSRAYLRRAARRGGAAWARLTRADRCGCGGERTRRPHGSLREAALLVPGLLMVGALLLLPLVWLLGLSFCEDGALSLVHYRRLIDDPTYAKSFLVTFQIAGTVTVLAILLGYPLCYWMLRLPQAVAGPRADLRAGPVLDEPARCAPMPGSCSCSGAASSTTRCRVSG